MESSNEASLAIQNYDFRNNIELSMNSFKNSIDSGMSVLNQASMTFQIFDFSTIFESSGKDLKKIAEDLKEQVSEFLTMLSTELLKSLEGVAQEFSKIMSLASGKMELSMDDFKNSIDGGVKALNEVSQSIQESNFCSAIDASTDGAMKKPKKASQALQDHDFSSAESSTGSSNKSAEDAKKKISELSSMLGSGLWKGVEEGAKGFSRIMNEASNMEKYRNTLDMVIKDNTKAGETMKWAMDFAQQNSFEPGMVVEATAKLEDYGISAKQVLPTVGNMAAYTHADLSEAAQAVADAQKGELAGIEKFGITKQMIVDNAAKTMRGKQITNSKGEITDQEAFNKAMLSLMDEKFKGGMERQANSYQGLMQSLGGGLSTALAEIGGMDTEGNIRAGSMFDLIKDAASSALGILREWQQDGTLQTIAQRFDSMLPVIVGVVAALYSFRIISTISTLMKAWKEATEAMTLVQKALNIAMRDNAIGIAVAVIGILVAAGIYLYQNWDTVKEKMSAVWESISDFFRSGCNTIAEYINILIDHLNCIPGVNIPHVGYLEAPDKPKSKTEDSQEKGKGKTKEKQKSVSEMLKANGGIGTTSALDIPGGSFSNVEQIMPVEKSNATTAKTKDKREQKAVSNVQQSVNITINAVKMNEEQIVSMVERRLLKVVKNMSVGVA